MKLLALPWPALLALFSGGAVAIVVLYTVRWRPPRRTVATVSFWREAARGRGAGRIGVIEHVLSLVLQLAALALLVLAAGQPRLGCQSRAGRAVVIVLDRSLSMGAMERVEPRLELARARALQRLARASDGDDVAVVLAGGDPVVAVPLERDRVPARRAIGRAELVRAPGRLQAAVELACALAASRDEVSVAVISDGSEPLASCDGAANETILVGTARPNLGISLLASAASPLDPAHPSAFVEVVNGAAHRATARLRLALDGSLVHVEDVALAPDARLQRTVSGLSPTAAGQLEARLTDIRFEGGGADALAADDSAQALLARPARVPVQLVGANEPLRLALAANPRLEVRSVDAPTANEGVAVIARALFAPLPPGRYLLVGTRADAATAGLGIVSGAPVDNPQITYWRAEHPILRRVVLSDVRIGSGARLALPASAVPLAGSPETPLLFTLDDGSRRVVGLGFDPSASNLPLRVAFPVLLYDAIEWLMRAPLADRGRSPTPSLAGEARLSPRFTAPPAPRVAGRGRDAELQVWLLLAAALLLSGEWLSYHRRKTV